MKSRSDNHWPARSARSDRTKFVFEPDSHLIATIVPVAPNLAQTRRSRLSRDNQPLTYTQSRSNVSQQKILVNEKRALGNGRVYFHTESV